MAKKKLTKDEWWELNTQYQNTPPCGDMIAPSGEHYLMWNLLRRFGYRVPSDCTSIMDKAEELLARGYDDD
ncbi:MAG: hypothetical protein ACOC8X_13860 [Chloroflexota bacterium]